MDNLEDRISAIESRIDDFNIRNNKFYNEMYEFLTKIIFRIEKLEDKLKYNHNFPD